MNKKWDISPRGCKTCDAPEALEETKKELAKCEDWEVKKKTELEAYLKEVENTLKTEKKCSPGTLHSYNPIAENAWGNIHFATACPNCKINIEIKTNNWGDKFIPEGVEEHNQSYFHKGCWEVSQSEHSQSQSLNKSDSLSQRERERERESNVSKPNYLPWVLGGVGVVALISGLVYFLTRKESK